MGVITQLNERPVHLTLAKDTSRYLKAGHPWIYRDALVDLPPAKPGSLALVKDKKGDILAKGFYDPKCPIAFRACALKERLDEDLIQRRMVQAIELRKACVESEHTNAFRVFNGEGDGLPGLTCDLYADSAVLKLDGDGPAGFYDVEAISQLLQQHWRLRTTYLKYKAGSQERGRLVAGQQPKAPVVFSENGVHFQADLVQGQKTGFFLDQRDNRQRIGRLARGKRVLNLFGYTGGFSMYAGVGGASHVTTVDLAEPAIAFANINWEQHNGLDPSRHEGHAADCFDFLESARKAKERWELVVVDPPSFAPNKESLERAKASYVRVFAAAAQVTAPGGLLAPSSCSSHVDSATFLELVREALRRCQRRGTVLGVYGQPLDHPFPLAAEELRYLKFALVQLD